ncbi:MAG: signal peptidase II [Tenericutes bacterium HGW-Tenericutes-4]|jgi:signal peptidase II|nr:MAG: signal peptidase II [Tenericutes bacterium HGW-Tenericutes-4]
MRKKQVIKYSLIVFFVFIDLLTKLLLDNKSITLINGVVRFESSHNTGAAWSMLEGKIWFFVLGAVIFIVAINLFDHFVKPQNKWYEWGFIFMLAGTIGNAIDRLIFGYVRDFIMLEFISFPIFNVADTLLSVGVVLFSVFILFYYDDKKKVAK